MQRCVSAKFFAWPVARTSAHYEAWKEAVVDVRAEEFERLRGRKHQGSLVQFFAKSPLAGSGIDLDRELDYGRTVEL